MDQEKSYNVTLGTDFLTKTGLDIKYSTKTTQCVDDELHMHDLLSMKNEEFLSMTNMVEQQSLERLRGMD